MSDYIVAYIHGKRRALLWCEVDHHKREEMREWDFRSDRLTPTEQGYSFEAPTRFDKLFSGVASPRPAWIKPGDVIGTEDIGPADTGDADYGRLLERVERRLADTYKRVTSLMPASWNRIAGWLQQIDAIRCAA